MKVIKDEIKEKKIATNIIIDAGDYQYNAHEFANYFNQNKNPKIYELFYPMAGLTEEVGELEGKIAKCYRDKDGYFSDEEEISIKKEIGDCFWMLAEIASFFDFNISDIMKQNIDKLIDRMNRNVIHGSGDDR